MANTPSLKESAAKEEHHLDLDQALKVGAPIILGILAVSILFLWQRNEGSGLRTEVSQAYTAARSVEELEAVAKAYPDQPEAPLALLQAAAEHYNSRSFETALASYDSFLSLYADHPLREHAEWGLWMTQEQLGELDTALNGFRSVTDQDLLYPQALLAQARVLEKQSSPTEAIEIYASVQEEFADTPWAQQAKVFSQQAALSITE